MATVTILPRQDQGSGGPRPSVIMRALATAGGSAAGICGILVASSYGAAPTAVAIVALVVFGVIMLVPLIISGIYGAGG
ncbi:hypothetical protein ACGFJ7_38805 [Actinoplanes sp. NPDC048988]|uniref:hypothetical protein n=1 Tax=Actinoplanes sp. NPDC048988 TaxID=3363901 RepID=UPI003722D79F